MEKRTSQRKERPLIYQQIQQTKERKLIAKQGSLKKSIEDNTNKIAELRAQLEVETHNKKDLIKTADEFADKYSIEIKQRKQKIAQLEEKTNIQKLSLTEYESKLKEILDEKLKESQESPHVLKIKSRLAYLNTEINESNFKIGEYKKEAKKEQTLAAQIEKLKKNEQTLSELIASGATSPKHNYVDEFDVAKKERIAFEKKLQDFLAEEQVEIARLTDIIGEMTIEAKSLNVELDNLRQTQDDATAAMKEIEKDPSIISLRKNVSDCNTILEDSTAEIARLTAEIAEIRAKELEAAKQAGKEQNYLALEKQLLSAQNDIKALESRIASDEKSIINLESQNQKNEAKLKEIDAAIFECDNYNIWIANNKKFSEEMYPKELELAAKDAKKDRLMAKTSVLDKLKEESRKELKNTLQECKVKAEKVVDAKKIKPTGAIRDIAVNSLTESLFARCLESYIDEKIEAGTSETWNKEFRKIRDERLKSIEKNIASAEKSLSNNKDSDEAKSALAEAQKAKEMFHKAEQDKTLLVIKNIRKYFPVERSFMGKPTRYLKAVDDVSLRIQKGKTLGIVGESGCGKTTLGRTVLRLHDITDGEIIFDGQHIEKLKSGGMRPLRTNLQIIFQDPYSSLSPRLSIGEIIGEAVRAHKIVPKSEYKDYIISIMKSCGLQPHHFSRYPHEFSGGQRQRICIARALAVNPKVVICDEPVSALDVSIQAQIINLLKDLQKTRNLTYIFISHDLSVVEHISDDVGVMYLGSMVESGPKEKIFDNPMHPYTQALLSAVPVPDPNVKMNRIFLKGDIPSPSRPPRGCKFHTRCHKCMEICKTMPPVYREYEEGHFVACHLYPQD